MNKELTYQQEMDKMLESFIFDKLYPRFNILKNQNNKNAYSVYTKKGLVLELYVTSACNKACQYCYLTNNKEKIYPQELDKPEIILKNLKIFLNHILEKFAPNGIDRLDLFSGEILGTKLGNSILDILLLYIKKGLKIKTIVLPTNGSFLLSETQTKKMEQYIDFFDQLNCKIIISFSNDGLIIDNKQRPFKDTKIFYNEDYYEKLKDFAAKYNFGFHPMVAQENIQYWVENLKWWKEYTKDTFPIFLQGTMFLEVRNDCWDETSITKYLEFLQEFHQLMYIDFKNANIIQSLEDYWKIVLDIGIDQELKDFISNLSYIPVILRSSNCISCNLTYGFCVRLGDLAICPCHRTAYNKLLYGKYKVQDNKIVGIEAINPMFLMHNYFMGQNGSFKCDTCIIKTQCIGGCRGAQLEANSDPLTPIDSVCLLEKIKFLYNMYWGVNELAEKEDLSSYMYYLKKFQQEEKEIYNKWIPIIQTLKPKL